VKEPSKNYDIWVRVRFLVKPRFWFGSFLLGSVSFPSLVASAGGVLINSCSGGGSGVELRETAAVDDKRHRRCTRRREGRPINQTISISPGPSPSPSLPGTHT